MKTKMKSIVLALACAIAASTASADHLKWFGERDGNWWTTNNWWNASADPGAYVSSDFAGDYVFGSIEFGAAINSNPGELGWGTLINSHTTINLGGSAKPIVVSGDIISSYDGKNGWGENYNGGPITLTNGTMVVNKSLQVGSGRWDANVGTRLSDLVLKDVNLTCNENIEILYGYQNVGYGNGRVTIEDGTYVSAGEMKMGVVDGDALAASTAEFVMNGGEATFLSFTCTCKDYITAIISLNKGELKVPGFSEQYNNPSPHTTLAFNGGTLTASQDSNGNVNGDSFVPKWMKVEIGEGGIVIDTDDAAGNSYDLTFAATNVTRASGVTIDGGLTKMGNGTLTVSEGQVWNGLTKILGGTLDLNGNTINGPLYLGGTLDLNGGKIGNVLILGGSGKIIDSSKENVDDVETERPEAYEFNPDMWGRIGQTNSWAITSIKVSGAAAFASPSNSVLKSATAWYDPSDTSVGNLTINENGGVTAIKNKSATGDSMNADLVPVIVKGENDVVVSEDYYPPTTTTINGHTAIALSNKPGFISAGAVSFDDPKGKSIFAVAQLNYENNESNGVYPIAMCSDNAWNHSGVFSMKLGVNEFKSFYRVKPRGSGGGYTTTEMNVEGNDTIGNDNVSYVMSLRGFAAEDNENYNVFSRIIGKDGTLDEEQKEGVELSFDEENPGWGSKDVISYGFKNNKDDGFSNQGAVGEALAFARCLSDEEAEVVQSYLVNKWVSSSIPATWPLTVGTLTLDGSADFDGANVTIGNLSGNGSMTGAASLKVTGTITATTGSTIEVDGDIDLTGATFAVDAALAESLAYNVSVTLLTSTGTITGLDSPVVLTVGTRKFKVSKSDGAITVMRLQPGLMIVIK